MDKKVCICTTLWSSINNWILPFLNEYNKRGIDVTIVCNMDNEFEQGLKEHFPFVRTYCIGFPRGINAIGSLKSIWTLRPTAHYQEMSCLKNIFVLAAFQLSQSVIMKHSRHIKLSMAFIIRLFLVI